MKRRNFLKIAGGAGLILAAGTGGFLATRNPASALAPWQQAGELYQDPMRKALSYALLAPNPHNRQPWQIKLISETEGLLLCDLDRRLPATDPFDRQIVIGLGCFLELFDLAAQANGHQATIELFPDGMPLGAELGRLDKRPIARLKLTPDTGSVADPLFAQCLDRHTNRGAYDPDRAVPTAIQAKILQAGRASFAQGNGSMGFIVANPDLRAIQALAVDGMTVEANNHETHMETVNLIRIGKDEVERNPDGIALYGPLFDGAKLAGMLDKDGLSDPNSAMFKSGADPMLDAVTKTPAFVWISTQDNDRVAQITAGRSYMRTCLAATEQGLSMQPVSQILQEYADMENLYQTVHARIVPDGVSRVQMLARIGYGKDSKPSPRWPLDSRILS